MACLTVKCYVSCCIWCIVVTNKYTHPYSSAALCPTAAAGKALIKQKYLTCFMLSYLFIFSVYFCVPLPQSSKRN